MEEANRKKFTSLFSQIKAEHGAAAAATPRTKDSDVLVVDGTQNFIRCWSVVPTLNKNGEHVGGISGFLGSLGYAIKLLRPTRVIIIFDGKGGSQRRKKIYPDYKDKRAAKFRVNRAYEDMSNPADEQESMIQQMVRLVDFLKSLPVTVISVDYIEADDAIAYIATQMYTTSKITIMSGDKDFLQLINERVTVWSPTKKKLYSVQDIINEYGVHPTNFIYYRILEGDTSDNIDGIKGIGLKTALKLFPVLADPREISVKILLESSNDRFNDKKIFAKIVEGADTIKRNYELMQLKAPSFSPSLQMQVMHSAGNSYEYNKFHFIQKLTTHGMHESIPNCHVWLQEVFNPLQVALSN